MIDSIRFGDFVKRSSDIIPEQYANLMLRDILHLKPIEIEKMGMIEYHEAINYVVMKFRLQTLYSEEKNSKDTIHFDQPADYDYDPTFVSKV